MFKREVMLYLWCKVTSKGLTPAAPPILTPVQDWVKRVQDNGGAKPSDATVATMQTFYSALDSGGLLSKMISVVCFVPDNLIAAITPLIKVKGNDPWTNNNFIAGDLTVNGLKGNGTSKYLDTGVWPLGVLPADTAFPSDTTCGLTVYKFDSVIQGTDMGCQQAGGLPIAQAAAQFNDGNCYFDCWNTTGGQGRISGGSGGFVGYFSFNRIAANDFKVYRANSGSAHGVFISGATSSPQGRPANKIFCFALADQTGLGVAFPVGWTSHRLSFSAVHLGLTQAESLSFFNAIQALRTGLGGGAI